MSSLFSPSHATTVSCLDHCSSLFLSLLDFALARLHCSPHKARATPLTSKLDHITPLLKIPQWFPTSEWKPRSLWWPTKPWQIWCLCPHLLPLSIAHSAPVTLFCCSLNMSGTHLLHGSDICMVPSIMSFISLPKRHLLRKAFPDCADKPVLLTSLWPVSPK